MSLKIEDYDIIHNLKTDDHYLIKKEWHSRVDVEIFMVQITQDQKLRELIEEKAKYPQAMNYATFEEWIKDVLAEAKNIKLIPKDSSEKESTK